jgi:hypothetical protein
MSDKNRKTLKYSFGEHPTSKDVIVIEFYGTEIDLDNPDHRHFVDVLSKVISAQLYGKSQGVDINSIKF